MANRELIRSHHQLEVYQIAFNAAMKIFETSKGFPNEEKYSLTNQVRRSSRSVYANITEAWRKRRYEAAFISKLNDAEAEAAETQTWVHFGVKCGYLERPVAEEIFQMYEHILGMLVTMIRNPRPWLVKKT